MARLLSQKAQTGNVTIGSPTEGMKWVVKWALVVLHTGTGSGSRVVNILVNRAAVNVNGSGSGLASSGVQSGTSTNYIGYGDVTTSINGTYTITFSRFPEVFSVDVIMANVTLISGDTYDYYILVEEASS